MARPRCVNPFTVPAKPVLCLWLMSSSPSSSWDKTQQEKKHFVVPSRAGLRLRPGTFSSSVLWVRAPTLVLSHCLAEAGQGKCESEGTRLTSESPWFYPGWGADPALTLRVHRTNLEDSKNEVAAFSSAHAWASIHSVSKKNLK